MTNSLGWVLAQCPTFLATVLRYVFGKNIIHEGIEIFVQRHEHKKGFTDIEIKSDGLHIIIEAKKGFNVPGNQQLEKYADRMSNQGVRNQEKMLIVLAEDDRREQWLKSQVVDQIKGISVKTISWQKLRTMCRTNDSIKKASNAQKRLIRQFYDYIGRLVRVKDSHSNSVYVVSLGKHIFFDRDVTKCQKDMSFIDIVEEFQKYFHPVGGDRKGWPVNPPNYIAFRYHSVLQSIHYIEDVLLFDDFSKHFPLKSKFSADGPHYLYTLGPAIQPENVGINDPDKKYARIVRSSRRWADLDLLLTSKSIAEAVVKTSRRHS